MVIMMRTSISLTVLCTVLGCSVARATLQESEQAEDVQAIQHLGQLSPPILDGLRRDSRLKRLQTSVERLKKEPLYLRLSYAPYFVELLEDGQERETLYYEWEDGTHDLRIVAGRAGWLLQEVYDIEVVTIDSSTTAKARKQARDLARAQLDVYIACAMVQVELDSVGRNIDGLKAEYQAKFLRELPHENSTRFDMGAGKLFAALFDDFFPLGKKLEDLERIVGRKAYAYESKLRNRESSEEVTGVFEYGYSDGFSGKVYYLLVRDGVIETMSTRPL